MKKQVKHRLYLSQWCILITFDDGTIAIWNGPSRVELGAYEVTRLTFALQNEMQQKDDALYEAAKADESKAFVDSDETEHRDVVNALFQFPRTWGEN
jgi:hypothetical protein